MKKPFQFFSHFTITHNMDDCLKTDGLICIFFVFYLDLAQISSDRIFLLSITSHFLIYNTCSLILSIDDNLPRKFDCEFDVGPRNDCVKLQLFFLTGVESPETRRGQRTSRIRSENWYVKDIVHKNEVQASLKNKFYCGTEKNIRRSIVSNRRVFIEIVNTDQRIITNYLFKKQFLFKLNSMAHRKDDQTN